MSVVDCPRCGENTIGENTDYCDNCGAEAGIIVRMLSGKESETQRDIAAFIRRPHEDGTPCSADREVLASRIERGDWRK